MTVPIRGVKVTRQMRKAAVKGRLRIALQFTNGMLLDTGWNDLDALQRGEVFHSGVRFLATKFYRHGFPVFLQVSE